MQPLIFNALGDFQVLRNGEPLRFAYDKMRALFAYLVTEQRSLHRRERLAHLLWPDCPDGQARANLRTALSRLNTLVGGSTIPFYLRQATQIRFNPAFPLQEDVTRLLETAPEAGDGSQAEAVARALSLCHGPFLADFELPGCDEFNAWAEEWRTRIRSHALLLASAAMAFHQENGRPQAALLYAERRVELAPWDEAGQRALMRLLAVLGQTGAVVERFEALRRGLRDGYGTEPEAATVALVRELCGGPPSPVKTDELRYLSALYVRFSVAETDDVEYQAALLEAIGAELTALAGERGGHVIRTHAGGLLVYFGSTVVREDDARQAVATALVLGRHAERSEAKVAMGIHSAVAIAGAWSPDRSDRVTSAAMHLAELASDAMPVVSAGTVALLQEWFELEPVEEECYRVLGVRDDAGRSGGTPHATLFAGRGDELAALRASWEEVRAGAGRVLLLRGEPGAGKSRLLEEFFATLPDRRRLFLLQCLGRDEERPFHPLNNLLQRLAGLRADDTPAVLREKLRPICAGQTAAGERRLAIMSRLLGDQGPRDSVVPAGFGRQLLRAVLTLTRFTARTEPLVIVIEDLHWADPSTLQLLRGFIGRHPRVLLLMTARPEFAPEQLDIADCMDLRRLDEGDARAIARALTADETPDSVVDAIVARAEGVPLFIEELARTANDAGEGDAGLSMRLGGLLVARLDRLGSAKRVVQCAAVLGREFPVSHLDAVVGGGVSMAAPLERLIGEGVLVRMADGERLRFHHSLYQDAAYSTLIGREREELHFQVARLFEDGDVTRSVQAPETIAWHYDRARAPLDAAGWWLKAGRRAMGQGAMIEASAHLRHGLAQVSRMPEALYPSALERELQVVLGTVLFMLEGYGSRAAAACFDRATVLLTPDTAIDRDFGVRWGIWLGSSTRWGHVAGRDKAHGLVALAERSGDPALQALAWWALGNSQLWLGEQASAGDSLRRAIDCYHRRGGDHPPIDTIDDAGVMAHAFLSWNAWLCGDDNCSHAAGEAAFEQAGGRPGPLSYALAFAAFLAGMKGDAEAALPLAERLMNHGRDHHFALWDATGRAIRGWALAMGRGQTDGIAEIEAATAMVSQVMPSIAMTYHSMLAEAYGALGDAAAQLRVVDGALAMGERYQDSFLVAELYRFRGNALDAGGEFTAARDAYNRALAVATAQGAHPFAQRARAALAASGRRRLTRAPV